MWEEQVKEYQNKGRKEGKKEARGGERDEELEEEVKRRERGEGKRERREERVRIGGIIDCDVRRKIVKKPRFVGEERGRHC